MPNREDTNPFEEALKPFIRHEIRNAIEQIRCELAPAPAAQIVPAGEVLLTIGDLEQRLQQARSTIWKSVLEKRFPQPLKLGRSSRWRPKGTRR